MQEAYWKGGNKNEFILCVGVKDKYIQWTKVISWTDREQLKVRVARKVKEMDTLSMPNVINYVAGEVRDGFVKKDFRQFDYLTVEPTETACIVALIISLLLTIGLMIFSVEDEYEP
jgi:hypothetical protein